MEAHKELKKYIQEELGVKVLDYAYKDVEQGKAIEIDFAREDYDKLSEEKRIYVGEFKFKRKLFVQENKDGTLTYEYLITPREDIDHSTQIDEKRRRYGAIAPDGKFYECGYAGHNNLEYDLEVKGLIRKSPIWNISAFDYYGWVKLTGSSWTDCEFVFDFKVTEYDFDKKEDILLAENEITQEQLDTIKKYLDINERKYFNFQYHWYKTEEFSEFVEKKQEYLDDNLYNLKGEEEEKASKELKGW